MATATKENTDLTLSVSSDKLAFLETVVAKCGVAALATCSHFERSFRMATGIRALEQAITDDMMDDIMALQSSPLGFLTDKDSGQGYQVHIVKRVFIEATLNGARMVGNEVNIISGRMYLTKQYYQRVTREFPGVEGVAEQPGVPAMGANGALVPFIVTWQKGGQIFSVQCTQKKDKDGNIMDERVPVKVNSGMGADAILGKATRKALKRAYDRMLGFSTPDNDPDENVIDETRAPRSLSALTARLTGTEVPPTASTNGNGQHKPEDTGLEPGERVGAGGEIVNTEVQPTEPAKTETAKTETAKTASKTQHTTDTSQLDPMEELRQLARDEGCPEPKLEQFVQEAYSTNDPGLHLRRKPWNGRGANSNKGKQQTAFDTNAGTGN